MRVFNFYLDKIYFAKFYLFIYWNNCKFIKNCETKFSQQMIICLVNNAVRKKKLNNY